MTKKLLQLGMAAALFAGICAAEQKTITGYLIDKACSSDAIKKGESMAKTHDIGCLTMDDCARSGFGVYTTDGKFVSFDAAGNKQALAAVKSSGKKTDLRVTVTGNVTGDTMTVSSIKIN